MFLAILSLLCAIGVSVLCFWVGAETTTWTNPDVLFGFIGMVAFALITLIYGLWKLNDETDCFYNLFNHLDKKLEEHEERVAAERAAQVRELVKIEGSRGVKEEYAKRAAEGDAEAQTALAIAYYFGNYLTQDYQRAVYWARRAYKQNDNARALLADCYRLGDGVEKDERKAIKYARPAAENGNKYAQFTVGWIYHCGTQVEHDYAEAVCWYQKAAAQGNTTAQNNLGNMYNHGHGVEKDEKRAIYWYEKAIAGGDDKAPYNLGLAYRDGKGVVRDRKKAKELFALAVERGYIKAQEALDKL